MQQCDIVLVGELVLVRSGSTTRSTSTTSATSIDTSSSVPASASSNLLHITQHLSDCDECQIPNLLEPFMESGLIHHFVRLLLLLFVDDVYHFCLTIFTMCFTCCSILVF
jgi:hypothetical protein